LLVDVASGCLILLREDQRFSIVYGAAQIMLYEVKQQQNGDP
jgi:hypothetical protein